MSAERLQPVLQHSTTRKTLRFENNDASDMRPSSSYIESLEMQLNTMKRAVQRLQSEKAVLSQNLNEAHTELDERVKIGGATRQTSERQLVTVLSANVSLVSEPQSSIHMTLRIEPFPTCCFGF
jgi:hypothetical protein